MKIKDELIPNMVIEVCNTGGYELIHTYKNSKGKETKSSTYYSTLENAIYAAVKKTIEIDCEGQELCIKDYYEKFNDKFSKVKQLMK